MRRGLWLRVGMVVLVAGMASGGPPEETTRRLEMALRGLDREIFAGSYRMTTHAVISKPSGSDREATLEVIQATVAPGSEEKLEVVSATENGKDVTARRREELAKRKEKRDKEKVKKQKKEEEGSFSASMRLPGGEDVELFEFGPVRSEGGAQVAGFTPRASARKQEGITQGRFAWDAATGDPLWLEARYVDPPTGIKELILRFELARQGELLFPRRTTTRGIGGLRWIKRAFDVEITISEVTPAQPDSAQQAAGNG